MTTNQQQNSAPPPQTENERIRERKRKVIDTLQTKFSEDIWRSRLLKICGGDESRIMKSLQSFITYIMNDDGGKEGRGDKKYIADCSLSSISAAFLEAFQMGIEVGGGRDHAYLVNYAGQCELDISYKGFVYALGKHFDNPFVVAENVFDGDEFTSHITDTTATFSHKPKDPFKKTWETLRGCYCYFSYTQRENKQQVSRLVMIQRDGPDGLDMIRSKSKGSFAWKDFPFEQTKKSTCRRASKIPFAQIDFGDEDVNPETVDNRHYQLEGNSSDRLRLMMDKHKEILEDETKPEPKKSGEAAKATDTPHAGSQPVVDAAAANGKGGAKADAPAPAENMEAPAAGDVTEEENERRFQDIDDADFGDPNAGPVIEGKAEHVPTPAPATETAPAAAKADDGEAWDGQTLIIGGKAQVKDFPTAASAAIYLKKVISQRKHKASRLAIINENPKLAAALVRDGNGKMIEELHKLADQGE